ncbi:single-stranded-DNA-specific exonuclease RecJ [Granulosicoccus antarcticus]|uniref:Single-stranded-DNA-specific exonuclease RecJ n=1 Tax=Granulosicoccus antarcticus IMCC3135 TaxID=1192854 RepID=A0A2Z2P239_9GAMM|nr:single-stranded-DNA-specific exonuclease RecJ [Granulosicoccus antarcticus]ASJ75370.1 Single-stranded-DNA-specific exonuclease RecJ [Granulosicoccus antarcticus IMCC3135]
MVSTSKALAVHIIERAVPELPVVLHSNALVHRLLAARGVTDVAELDFSPADLPRPDLLPDIDKAVTRLLQARDQGERLLVVGDYDCDGATSTTVALLGLRMLGFEHIDFLIPSRFKFGYGLSPAIVDVAQELHQPAVILTVDNGVASVEGVETARHWGIDVVVTDHHLAPEILPLATAIVNPNVPGSTFPAKNLAGVGVIFYVLLAMRRQLAEQGDAHGKARLADLLDLVAIGTVADVVPLDRCNRILVEQGLRRIRSAHTRPGVLALMQVAGKDPATISTQDIGFGIGPRLNAAGRLDDMSVGVRCLMATSESSAMPLASSLNDLNQRRRTIEQDMRESAEEQLLNMDINGLEQNDSFSVCLMDEDWHEGVIGILAGRIKESLHRPCVVFAGGDGDNLKGSARSIKGVHIRDVLQSIATLHPGMIEKFGGHAMAAGLSLPRASFELFRGYFEETVRQAMGGRLVEREYEVDGTLDCDERNLDNARLLENLMPWGQGFEAPLFAGNFIIASQREVGDGKHLKLTLEDPQNHASVDAIAFNCVAVASPGEEVRLVYSLEMNTWRDRQQVQLRVHHLEAVVLR